MPVTTLHFVTRFLVFLLKISESTSLSLVTGRGTAKA